MGLKIRRGLEADLSGVTPDEAEFIWLTDTQKLVIGDGSTVEGLVIAGTSVWQPIITISSSAPSSPAVGDLWYDIS